MNSAEVNRKILHLSSIIVPIFAFFLPFEYSDIFVIFVAIIALIADFLIKRSTILQRFLPFLYRKVEISPYKLSGGSYMAIGFLLVASVFHRLEYIPAMMTVSICDTMAAFCGQKYGKIKIYKNKTFEGFCGFLLGGIVVYLLLLILKIPVDLTAFFVAIFCASAIEIYDFINDNLVVMLVVALVLHLFYI